MNTSFKGIIECATKVTYPQGGLKGASLLLAYAHLADNKLALFVGETPFHPVDSRWPDQPADHGSLKLKNKRVNILDSRILAVKGQEIKENKDVGRNDAGWQRVVGHIIDAHDIEEVEICFNDKVEIEIDVDADFRQSLCLQHTACHLAALALNIAAKDFWKKTLKDQELDTLKNGNFDQKAIERSSIFTDRAEDYYRIGSSLKKLFNVEGFLQNLPQIEKKVNALIAEWIATGAAVEVTAEEGRAVTDKRMWLCNLPLGTATIPCGGTHVQALSCFKSIQYSLERRDSKDIGVLAITKATI